jgi:hypothetical protein
MVGLLALLQSVNIALNHNLQNQLRNEAVVVADQQMARELAKGFENVSTSNKNTNESRQILNGFKNFSVVRTGSQYQNSKEVHYNVNWDYKGVRYTHDTAGIISRANQ